MARLYALPLRLLPNKISRKNVGGREIDRFRGIEPGEDDGRTEAWVGSCSRVNNIAEFEDKNTGMAKVALPDGETIYVQELIDRDPIRVLGSKHAEKYGNQVGLLVKLIDPKKQSVLQAHPDQTRAKQVFGSDFGKTECWYILSLRDDAPEKPYILIGFKEGVTREAFEELFDKEDYAGMAALCHKITLKPDEMYLINSGTIHSIGSCFFIEIQEPSDAIAKVLKNPGYPKGADAWKERELGTFRFEGIGAEENLKQCFVPRKGLRKERGGTEELLIGSSRTPCFGGLRYVVKDEFRPVDTGTFSIAIVLEGSGTIQGRAGKISVHRGDEVFLPAEIEDLSFVNADESDKLVIVRCLPPGAM